jgi:hypothetical protein
VLRALAKVACERTGEPLEGERVGRINLVGRVAFVQLAGDEIQLPAVM